MDLLSAPLVEEILLCLPAKWLIRLRAVSRRYNTIVLSPEFRGRYWQLHSPYLTGVFFQPFRWRQPCFLTASRRHPAFVSMFASDLAFVPPGPNASERTTIALDASGLFVMNSSAGLLLCSRGYPYLKPVHYYYICNPQTLQWLALPGLPGPPAKPQDGLLSVAACGSRFQVVLFDKHRFWEGSDLHMDLRVFSSDDGRWTDMRLTYPPLGVTAYAAPFLGRCGTAYWLGCVPHDKLIVYSSVHHNIRVLPVPCRADNSVINRCVGERCDGGLRYAHFNVEDFKVWDLLPAGQEEGGEQWVLVHQAGVMEILQRNPEAAGLMHAHLRCSIERSMEVNQLLNVLSFHPTDDDIIFLGIAGGVATYSIKHGTMGLRYICNNFHPTCPNEMTPYVHPDTGRPVHIPPVKGDRA